MTDVDLIHQLRSLATVVDIPDPVDIAVDVRRDLAALPLRGRAAMTLGRALRPALVTVATVVVAVVLVLATSPQARETVSDWLRIRGVDIGLGAPAQPDLTVGDPLSLATETTLDAAAQSVAFDIAAPERLGPPGRVYLDGSFPGGVVTMVWAPAADLPEVAEADVGALLSVFNANVDESLLRKFVDSLDTVERADVDGSPAVWIGGRSHLLVRDAHGANREVVSRLAGNTLLWQRGDVTYRLEADLDRAAMVAIAESTP